MALPLHFADILIRGSANTIGGSTPGDRNVIGYADSTDASVGFGIDVQGGDNNQITGNYIGTNSGGADFGNEGAGIWIRTTGPNGAIGNVIGGDTYATENVISNNGKTPVNPADPNSHGYDAIAIDGPESVGNRVLRNRGFHNGLAGEDLFVDLRFNVGTGDGFGNPANGSNRAVQAPRIMAASTERIVGLANADADVRVFSKSTAANGELNIFRRLVQAPSGLWRGIYYGPLALNQRITANQTTTANDSSEFAPRKPSIDGSGDSTAPVAQITGGPAGATNDTTPTFTFTSNEPGSQFVCRIDSADYRACNPGSFTSAPLAGGPHVFVVRAIDIAANLGGSAARSFSVN